MKKDVGEIIFLGLVIIAIVAAVPFAFMAGWNYIVPKLYPAIYHLNYWDSVVLLLVGNMLFGGLKSTSPSKNI